MRRSGTSLQFLLAAALLAGAASAADNAGTSGAAFLKVGAGARPAALGEAVTAVIDDVNAVAWNAAGLARVTSPQFTAVQSQWLQEYDHSFVAGAYPFSWGVVGFGFTSMSVEGIERRTTDVDAAEGTFGSDDTAYAFSYARALGESLSVGGGITLIRQSLDGHSASGMAGNLGIQWMPADRPLSLGASLRNMGSEIKFEEEGDPLPSVAAVGLGYRVMEGRLRLSADLRAPQNDDMSAGAGLELMKPLPSLGMSTAFRLGYNTASTGPTDGLVGVTGGLGVTWRNWGFDLAWAPYGDLGQTFRYALLVKF